jgi:multiple sugar transport system permease protein
MVTKKFNPGKTIVVVLMILLLIIVLYPFLWLIVSTFKVDTDIVKYPPTFFGTQFTFSSYVKVWQSIPLLDFLMNTVIFSGAVTVTSILFDSMAGYAFARFNFKGKNFLFTTVLITMMIPFQVVMIPLFIEVFKLGVLNTYAGLILPRMADAFGIFLMRAAFLSLPKELEEAARMDGCNEFQIFFKIMFPLCIPAVITLGIINLMGNWNDLLYPLMLTSTTNMRTISAGLAMFVGQRTLEYGPTLAAAAIALLPLIVIYIFAQKYFVQGIATTGLKG